MKRLVEDRRVLVAAWILGALVAGLWGCQKAALTPTPEEGVPEKTIRVEAEGDVLHFQETISWSEREFSRMLTDESDFSSRQIEAFNETYQVNADNFRVELIEEESATTLRCDVHDKYNGNWYDFHWLLNPLRLDFLDTPFERSSSSLTWQGLIDDTPTSIALDFPFPIANCHAHVWQK